MLYDLLCFQMGSTYNNPPGRGGGVGGLGEVGRGSLVLPTISRRRRSRSRSRGCCGG